MTSDLLYFLLWLFSSLNTESDTDNYVLGYREGLVGGGNFTYFYIYHLGGIVLSLKSKNGDADMYISDSNLFPTYEVDSYDVHSATCGQDVIEITESVKSPISVGIYGHSAYNTNNFVLEVYKAASNTVDGYFIIIDEELPEPIQAEAATKDDTKPKAIPRQKLKRKNQNISNKVTGLFSLFEIIQLIFL